MISVREWKETDDIEYITNLLHRAYAEHASQGLHFLASHQSVEVTRKRVRSGITLLALFNQTIVGTITIKIRSEASYGDYMTSEKIASFSQLAIDPNYRGKGWGSILIKHAEKVAIEKGCSELALDTSQHATKLINFYSELGFEIKGKADWRPTVNYESWIMVKIL
jgi:ribosomal protein S18 acetylase RimI-like enzyme